MRKFSLFILFLAVIAVVGGTRLLRLHDPDAIRAKNEAHLYIEQKADLNELTQLLVDSLQVVEDRQEMKWAANLLGWRNFQPGHYLIDEGFTYEKFLSKLAKGNQDPISLTIIPGQRKKKIIADLTDKMRFDSAAIYKTLKDSTLYLQHNVDKENLIGYFFPATYDLYWTLSPKATLNRILGEFNKRVREPYRSRAAVLELTMNEVLTLASIIEGEAIHDEEKSKISGLYWNRLNRNMPLQADPTISYAVNEKRRLYNKDYKVDHPYNTYIHKGLPPGPINNPSLSSIEAALYPDEHRYLFMVARPSGYHAFTETYAEHQEKSAEWREYLKKMENAAAKDSATGSN